MEKLRFKAEFTTGGCLLLAQNEKHIFVTDSDLISFLKKSQIKKVEKKDKTSPYQGVSWDSKSLKWKAQIYQDGKVSYIGCFESEEKAAKAYDHYFFKKNGVCKNFPTFVMKSETKENHIDITKALE